VIAISNVWELLCSVVEIQYAIQSIREIGIWASDEIFMGHPDFCTDE
jgi:hypothetical protein